MTPSAYIATLPTAEARADAVARWLLWYDWDCDTEYSPEDEDEYNRMMYLSVTLDVELGREEYTEEELADYRAA